MPFETLSSRSRQVAQSALALCINQYGRRQLKIEQSIASNIPWTPSFWLSHRRHQLLAIEASESIFPEVLKVASPNLIVAQRPITVYAACPLDEYLLKTNQALIRELRSFGVGLITVSEDDEAILQFGAAPLTQHIRPEELDSEIRDMRRRTVGRQLHHAYETYKTDPIQGLQQAGQIIESMVGCLIRAAISSMQINNSTRHAVLADQIDALYNVHINQRAVLGGAREFVRMYRNPSSHAPKSVREAVDRFRFARRGFLRAIEVARGLETAAKALQVRIILNL